MRGASACGVAGGGASASASAAMAFMAGASVAGPFPWPAWGRIVPSFHYDARP
jgi:hypothetical protein